MPQIDGPFLGDTWPTLQFPHALMYNTANEIQLVTGTLASAAPFYTSSDSFTVMFSSKIITPTVSLCFLYSCSHVTR